MQLRLQIPSALAISLGCIYVQVCLFLLTKVVFKIYNQAAISLGCIYLEVCPGVLLPQTDTDKRCARRGDSMRHPCRVVWGIWILAAVNVGSKDCLQARCALAFPSSG